MHLYHNLQKGLKQNDTFFALGVYEILYYSTY